MKRDLLEGAVADAKLVREMAIANAKKTLEETFTPHLSQMFSAKLNEMEKEEETIEEVENSDEEINEVEEEVYENEESTDNDDIDLDELLSELSEEQVDEAKKDDEPKAPTKPKAPKAEEEEVDLKDMSESDLEDLVKDVIKGMVSAGELEAGHEDMEDEVGAEADVNLEEILNEIALDEAKKKKAKKTDTKEIDRKEKELNEARQNIDKLREEMNEVNLLNAKLLYVNKIFKAKNLTEGTKVKVLSSFDKAKTVKETKLVYETILSSLGKTSSKKSIIENLGSASKAITNKSSNKPIIETNLVFNRMQKLAGIKIKN